MSKTPEGRIKDAVDVYLRDLGLTPAGKAAVIEPGSNGWYFKPVSSGMGVHGIPDFLGHYKGRLFAIETKVPGKDPTPLQMHQIKAINLTGAVCFVIRSVEDLMYVETWRKKVDEEIAQLKNC